MRISQLPVEVLGAVTPASVEEPDHDLAVTSDSAGSWGTFTSGGTYPQWWEYSVNAEWHLSTESQSGNEERIEGWIHFPAVALPDNATVTTAWLALSTTPRPEL